MDWNRLITMLSKMFVRSAVKVGQTVSEIEDQ